MSLPEFGAIISPYGSIIKDIEEYSSLGFDFLEFSLEEPFAMPEFFSKNKQKILKLLDKHGMFATAHSPLTTALASDFKEVRTGWMKVIENYMRVLKVLKVEKMNFHTFHVIHSIKNEDNIEIQFLLNLDKNLNELIELGNNYGMRILVENTMGLWGYGEVKYFKHLLDKVPNLGMNLDIAHAFVTGGMQSIEKYIKSLGTRIEHVHMHDNHGKNDEHLPIGRGSIDWKRVVGLLKRINYDKTITFEVFTSKKDAVKSREKIRKLWME